MESLERYLAGRAYIGRGLLLGAHEDGYSAVLAYFITGRSEASRMRVLEIDDSHLRTRAIGGAAMQDSSLFLYSPVASRGSDTVITNGDHTDTIISHLDNGGSFHSAMRTRSYEHDPLSTPRIAGIVTCDKSAISYTLGVIKRLHPNGEAPYRGFYEYDRPIPGTGHTLHTYGGDPIDVVPYHGEPTMVRVEGGIDDLSCSIWGSLRAEYRVALYVRYIDSRSGEKAERLINERSEGLGYA